MGRSIVSRADSCVGSELDLATGVALAFKLQKSERVILVTFGDGTSNKGNFHEALTFASVQKLPIVFLCRNNGWAMSMPTSRAVPVENIADRAVSYGIPGVVVDGNDILAVRDAVKEAAERARHGLGPTLIEAKTYRLSPHSAHDEDNYRSKEEKDFWAQKDPLIRFAEQLKDAGIPEEDLERIRTQCNQEVEEAENWALTRPAVTAEEVLSIQQRVVNNMWGRQ
jgi:TPP-dependent pyruvate/acetoin dehydrogenase alpha subunit